MRRLPVLFLALTLATGCATVISGPAETITVTSEPSGAELSVDCGSEKNVFVTPARFEVARRSSDCTLTLRKEGFETETAVLEQGINRWTWGNLPIAILGVAAVGMSGFSDDSDQGARLGGALVAVGLGGLAADRLTFRMRDHDPKTLHVKLRPRAAGSAAANPPAMQHMRLRPRL